MTRREALSLLLLGSVAAAFGAPVHDLSPAPPMPFLGTIFRSRASAAAVGRAYLATAPVEADLDFLLDAVLGDDLSAHKRSEVGVLLSSRIAADFAAGRIAIVDGWRLALTEARLCAIAMLAPATASEAL